MTIAPDELLPERGGVVARINVRGSAVLASPSINRGTAFSLDERVALGLDGVLPTGVTTLEARTDDPGGTDAAGGDQPVLSAGQPGTAARGHLGLLYFQEPYTRSREEVRSWPAGSGRVRLAEVVAHAHPTILIGTSTHSGAFTEAIVKGMAAHTDRPIIMRLSNPMWRPVYPRIELEER